jgi:hypothetical protein
MLAECPQAAAAAAPQPTLLWLSPCSLLFTLVFWSAMCDRFRCVG